MKEVEGVMILFRFSTEPNRKVKLSKMNLPQTMHGEMEGFVNVDPLNIFACWCTYPLSVFLLEEAD